MKTCCYIALLLLGTLSQTMTGHTLPCAPTDTENKQACRTDCLTAKSSPQLFRQNGIMLSTVLHTCNITSPEQGQDCSVDVQDLTGPLAELGNTPVIIYLTLKCSGDTGSIDIVNHSNVSYPQVISYLRIKKCSFYWEGTNTFGLSTDCRVLIVENSEGTYYEKSEVFSGSLLGRNTSSVCGDIPPAPPGLVNVGTLISASINLTSVSPVFYSYCWPKMAEIEFNNIGPEKTKLEHVDLITKAMPRLQGLDLHGFLMDHPFNKFPWDQDYFALPANLSRSETAQSHYTTAINIIIEPHLYRRVYQVSLNQIQNMSTFAFHGVLDRISMDNSEIQEISENCFSNVSGLQAVSMKANLLSSIPEKLFQGIETLRFIDLSHNKIHRISPKTFSGSQNLIHINLQGNALMSLEHGTFDYITNLQTLDLSFNNISHIDNNAVDQDSPHLKKIMLQNNKISIVPLFIFVLRQLESADLSHNQVTFSTLLESINNIAESHLVFIHKESASTYQPDFKPLPLIELKLDHNNITSLDVEQMDRTTQKVFYVILRTFDITFGGSLTCDCHMENVHRAMQGKLEYDGTPVVIAEEYKTSIVCARPVWLAQKALHDLRSEDLACLEDIDLCPSRCKCYRNVEGWMAVNCSSTPLTELPKILPNNTKILLARAVGLEKLDHFPNYISSLKILDMSHNNISKISGKFWKKLTTVGNGTHVSLNHNRLEYLPKTTADVGFTLNIGTNPYRCDCHLKWMKDWLVTNRKVIHDLEHITCGTGKPSGQKVIDVDRSDFVCEADATIVLRNSLIIGGVLLLLFFLVLSIVYSYRGEIKILLYVHFHIHPFDKTEEADILDMDHDVFISYCGTDYKWVVFELLKRIEAHDPPYRTCLHDRDFEVGAPIQDNIMSAINKSRRMIMVLSTSYLQSRWCMLEFRAAHQRVLNERTNYLILVLYDDIDVNELDEDLQLYIRTNTYLSKDNKWFWDKLFYAMPVTPLFELRKEHFYRQHRTSDSALGVEMDSLTCSARLPTTIEKMNW